MIRVYLDYQLQDDLASDGMIITLRDVTGLPTDGILWIDGEYIRYDGISSLDLTIVERGLYKTIAVEHKTGGFVWFLADPSNPLDWPGEFVRLEGYIDPATLTDYPAVDNFWRKDGLLLTSSELMTEYNDGYQIIHGPTLRPVSPETTIEFQVVGQEGGTNTDTETLTFVVRHSAYVFLDGREDGEPVYKSQVPEKPVLTNPAANLWRVAVGYSSWEQVGTYVFMRVDAYSTDTPFTSLDIDWNDGSPVETYLLNQRIVHDRYDHRYVSPFPAPPGAYTPTINLYDAGGVVITSIGPVIPIPSIDTFNVDQLLTEYRVYGTWESALQPSKYINDWAPPPTSGNVEAYELDPLFTYKFRTWIRQITDDGREYPRPPVMTSDPSPWNASLLFVGSFNEDTEWIGAGPCTVTMAHGLGNDRLVLTVYDEDHNVITPTMRVDATNIYVDVPTLNDRFSGKVVARGSGTQINFVIADFIGGPGLWYVAAIHDFPLGNDTLIVTVYDSAGNVVHPDSVNISSIESQPNFLVIVVIGAGARFDGRFVYRYATRQYDFDATWDGTGPYYNQIDHGYNTPHFVMQTVNKEPGAAYKIVPPIEAAQLADIEKLYNEVILAPNQFTGHFNILYDS